MTIRVVMPQMGESLAEGTLVRWLKSVGDTIARDEALFEISTDKIDTDVPAPSAGVLREILVREGETVAVGAPVAVIEPLTASQEITSGRNDDQAGLREPGPKPRVEPSVAPQEPHEAATAASEESSHFKTSHAPQLVSFRRPPAGSLESSAQPAPQSSAPASQSSVLVPQSSYSPAVLEAARQGGMSLATLTSLRGSGRGGRVTKRDVERFLREPQAPAAGMAASSSDVGVPPEYVYQAKAEDRRQPMSPVRRKIAHHMSWSVRISPHTTAFGECDMSRAAAFIARGRDRFAAEAGAPLTYTVLAAQAAIAALNEFPTLNASVVGDELVLKPNVNLGIAVALAESDELIVPVIRAANQLSLSGLARAIHDVATRARERRLRPEDVQNGTFTLTNPGIFGGLGGTPILNQPQVAILGLGAITKRVVVVGEDDAIAVRPMMSLSLTFDHRAADGMVAFRYLERLRQRLESVE